MGGHRKPLLELHGALIVECLQAVPDMTVREMVAEHAEHGIASCPVSVWRLFSSAGLSFKKSLFAAEQMRPKVARRREQ